MSEIRSTHNEFITRNPVSEKWAEVGEVSYFATRDVSDEFWQEIGTIDHLKQLLGLRTLTTEVCFLLVGREVETADATRRFLRTAPKSIKIPVRENPDQVR